MNWVPPIDSVQHVCELRRRDSNHAIGQRWPDEAALLQPLGVERHAEPVMPKNLNQVTRSHVILHTDRNLLSFTILGIRCMGSGCAYNNDQHDGVNRLFILRSALTSHGRFPSGLPRAIRRPCAVSCVSLCRRGTAGTRSVKSRWSLMSGLQKLFGWSSTSSANLAARARSCSGHKTQESSYP